MELFTLDMSNKSLVVINKAEVLLIPEFKRLLSRDRGSEGDADGRKKFKAIKEFTYIWYYCSFTSPIFDWSDRDRHLEALKISTLKESNIDTDVDAAIIAYKTYTNVISLRLYTSVLEGCNKLEQHFSSIDFEEEDEFGKRKNNPKDFISNVKMLKSTFKELNEFRDMVKQDLAGKTKMRGNSKKGNREDPN
jgi:hypothetical protein